MITNVHEIEEYLFCPRQYYYHKQGIHIDSELLKHGRFHHRKTQNIYLTNGTVNGILDKIEGDKIIELKRARSHTLKKPHKIQLLAYIYLAQENGFVINRGIVRYSNGKEFLVVFNRNSKRYLNKIIRKMKATKELPERTGTKSKCIYCSLREYCFI